MKEFKYTIDGKEYKVQIDAVEGNIASVNVNGEAYKVHVLVTCPKCGPTIKPIEYNYSGFYNAEKSRFEIQKEGFFESFTIDQSNGKAMSDRFPKFLFTKLNNK